MSKQTEALKLALEALEDCYSTGGDGYEPLYQFYDGDLVNAAIIAIREALAEQPAQQQEPVAYASDVEFDDETEIIPAEQKGKLGTAGLRIPLYIDPPASKPWVGLTNQELIDLTAIYSGAPLYCAIEAKLREKNA